MNFHARFLFVAFFGLSSLQTRAAETIFELIPFGDSWLYEDSNTELDFSWINASYDDTGWSSGPAQLGFGDRPADESTTLVKGSPTFYFRKHFTMTQAQIDALEVDGFYEIIVDMIYDDGAVVHINGFPELASVNMPNTFIEHSTLASSGAENTPVELIFEGTGLLQAGDNVISVEMHQSSVGSSDMSFDLAMRATKSAPKFGVYTPPQTISFDDDNSSGALDYNPNEGAGEMGWFGDWLIGGGPPASIGAFDAHPVTGQPSGGFIDGTAYIISQGFGWVTTEDPSSDPRDELKYRVDLRNYSDVEVSYGVRVINDGSLGFGLTDSLKYISRTSPNGQDFTEVIENEIKGGTPLGVASFIEETSPKRAHVPTSGVLGTSWRNPGFDDSSWQEVASGGVGYDSAVDYIPHIGFNTSTLMRNRNATCYMRIPFDVSDPSALTSLILQARADDGFVAFLNGVEVKNFNAPTTNTLQWNSTASGNNTDSTAIKLTSHNISAHLGELVVGENILAVHCLNTSTGSSDFLVSVRLEGALGVGSERRDPPEDLNDLDFGLNAGFYRFTHSIPDSVRSYLWRFEVRTDASTELVLFDNWRLIGTPNAVDSYESWILLDHPNLDLDEDGDRTSDPDQDGIPNYLEYAFGSDPEVFGHTVPGDEPGDPELSVLPTIAFVEDGGQMWYEITWRQLNLATTGGLSFSDGGGFVVRDIKYIPQFSEDLEVWNDGTNVFGTTELSGEIVEHEDGTASYTARYMLTPILNPNDPEPLFGRLRIEDAQPFLD